MGAAESDRRIEQLRQPRTLEDDIRPLRRDTPHLPRHVLRAGIDQVAGPHLPRDLKRLRIDIHGDDGAAAMHAGREHSQTDRPHPVDHDRLAHTWVRHVHAVQADCGHHKHGGRLHRRARIEMIRAVRRVGAKDGVRGVGAADTGDRIAVGERHRVVAAEVDPIAYLKIRNLRARRLDGSGPHIAGAERIGSPGELVPHQGELRADTHARIVRTDRDLVRRRSGRTTSSSENCRASLQISARAFIFPLLLRHAGTRCRRTYSRAAARLGRRHAERLPAVGRYRLQAPISSSSRGVMLSHDGIDGKISYNKPRLPPSGSRDGGRRISMNGIGKVVIAAVILCAVGPAGAQPGPQAKKLIEYGWDVPTPAQMRDSLADMEKRPFDGIIFHLAEGTTRLRASRWNRRSSRRTSGSRDLPFKRFKENFILVWGSAEAGWDWFTTTSGGPWRRMRPCSRASAGPGTCAASASTRSRTCSIPGSTQSSRKRARTPSKSTGAKFGNAARGSCARSRRRCPRRSCSPSSTSACSETCSDEPDPAILSRRLQAHRWGLMADFLIGMLNGASPRARFVDGNESSYYYTGREPFFRAYHTIHERALSLIPPELREKYRRNVEAGQALYVDHLFALRQPNPRQYLSYKLTPDERARWFEHNAYYALYTTDAYVWCYSERMNWWKNETPPGVEEALSRAVGKIKEGRPLGFDIEPLLTEAAKRPLPPAK